jgi:hypothetical protein
MVYGTNPRSWHQLTSEYRRCARCMVLFRQITPLCEKKHVEMNSREDAKTRRDTDKVSAVLLFQTAPFRQDVMDISAKAF